MNKLLVVLLVFFVLVAVNVPVRQANASTQFTASVSGSTNAVGRRLTSSGWWMGGSTVFASGRNTSTAYSYGTGMRFTGVTIPKGARIDSAYISIKCRTGGSQSTCNSYVSCEATDNPGVFADSASAFDTRYANHGTLVPWNNIGAWVQNYTYNSVDISVAIQERVNSNGWSSGNAIVVFWEDFANRSTVNNAIRYGYGYTSPMGIVINWSYGSDGVVSVDAVAKLSVITLDGVTYGIVKSIDGVQ